ncbi:tRNA (adenosine(37)-N6)-threonylcarbamoyltransferase complex dimerization subunit type 1 TsaB [Empedobacter stercoris]|uniref:tRNA (Adenosine(37)-N6)-threonylcarbamoyltransferase complex dimerization subunit type 1 TsaB n=1 Tax=Empedobacter stercoris TaxID=1628248 RepID=A0ABX1WND0_9FLAO|nr:tRNA (adenosine(37)-N6)-threonylcarbamoyltransferase complex dimerization subunit type 1 TsaB [Empedobacter stercoris]MCA4776929.1 tRNA (adenosine(37)-N6)-threonylcarbamoyltransferase complex dimerization subunit type 1 TsaB [Empedobacter stercoris]MCA4782565.1 tRNA (adenosine(37)-N6)-threonylcarbamoyltransferase complex dimerization subunit type 1 TsaB [Empedobacter stercoris]MCA4809827.1 tRNA (adenosine(37)-N6)-threonylcarbamoyltransferase complex dimerization subunit type 1 TsaB [Empedobac
MATILNLETSTKNCSVSIAKDGVQLCLVEENEENYAHGEKLNQFVDWCVQGAEINWKDIDAVCVSKGPGSYTGLRIGVSSAKGFAYGSDIPLMAINSLQILAESQLNQEVDYIIPMIDARRMEVYTALFDRKGNQLTETEAKVIDDTSFEELKGKKIIFVGDGAEKCQEILSHLNATFVQAFPSAKDMIRVSEEKFTQKSFEDVAYFEPYYLKDFVAGKKKSE